MKRLAVIIILMIALFSGLFAWGESLGWMEPEFAQGKLQTLRNSGKGQLIVAGAVIGALLVDILLPVPSSIVMALSGKFLGFIPGGLIAFAGAMLAAWVGFLACRIGGHRAFAKLVGTKDNARISEWFEEYGVFAIIISRPIPMLTEILSCLAGLSNMSLRTFTWASILGTLPICFVYSYVGSRGEITDPWPAIWVGILIPAIGWFVARFIKRRKTEEKESPDHE